MSVKRDGRVPAPCPFRPCRHTSPAGGAALTSAKILLNQFHLQMEYLLLKLTDGVLGSLPPCHHVAQVPHLKRHRTEFSLTYHLKGAWLLPPLCPRSLRNSLPNPEHAGSIWSLTGDPLFLSQQSNPTDTPITGKPSACPKTPASPCFQTSTSWQSTSPKSTCYT